MVPEAPTVDRVLVPPLTNRHVGEEGNHIEVQRSLHHHSVVKHAPIISPRAPDKGIREDVLFHMGRDSIGDLLKSVRKVSREIPKVSVEAFKLEQQVLGLGQEEIQRRGREDLSLSQSFDHLGGLGAEVQSGRGLGQVIWILRAVQDDAGPAVPTQGAPEQLSQFGVPVQGWAVADNGANHMPQCMERQVDGLPLKLPLLRVPSTTTCGAKGIHIHRPLECGILALHPDRLGASQVYHSQRGMGRALHIRRGWVEDLVVHIEDAQGMGPRRRRVPCRSSNPAVPVCHFQQLHGVLA
mmetsp:Transcript_5206/g.15286  ORF Transcript_5206/g.15286 Transcript_5206/m.15286 type:complete len:296 (+) Transcript_5206:323-1210(+)